MTRVRDLILAFPLLLLLIPAGPAQAVEPDEVLSDPAQEERARDLSAQLRCMVCQNQSIDDSNAALARDLRVLVRDRVSAGDTDAEVLDYIVSRYGEFVLLKPRFSLRNAILWLTPAVFLVAGGLLTLTVMRHRTQRREFLLSPDEEDELRRIIGESD